MIEQGPLRAALRRALDTTEHQLLQGEITTGQDVVDGLLSVGTQVPGQDGPGVDHQTYREMVGSVLAGADRVLQGLNCSPAPGTPPTGPEDAERAIQQVAAIPSAYRARNHLGAARVLLDQHSRG